MNASKLGLAVGALALAVSTAACGSSSSVGNTPLTSASSGASTTSTSTSKVVPLKASGTGGKANSVTILQGGQESQHQGVALPYSTTVPDGQADYGLTVQSGDSSASGTVTCEIDQPGHKPVTNSSTGAFAVVDCTGAIG